MITIIDVCRELGVETLPELTWSVGAAVREAWERRHGSAPEKALRTKTRGGGSHCFAVYPDSMRPDIVMIIQMHVTQAERQLRLF